MAETTPAFKCVYCGKKMRCVGEHGILDYVDTLVRKLIDLERDAARLDWWDKHPDNITGSFMTGFTVEGISTRPHFDTIRQATDAAMAAADDDRGE